MDDRQENEVFANTPLLSIKYKTAKHVKSILGYSLILLCIILGFISMPIAIWDYFSTVSGWRVFFSCLVSILGIVVIFYTLSLIPFVVRSILSVGNIYFFSDVIAIESFLLTNHMKYIPYTDTDIQYMSSWQWTIKINAYPGMKRFIQKTFVVMVKGKENVEKTKCLLNSINIPIVDNPMARWIVAG